MVYTDSAIIFALLLIVFLIVSFYSNRLIVLHEKCDKAFETIDAQIHIRCKLILTLLETAKKYAPQEKEIFEKIEASCVRAGNANTIKDAVDAQAEVNQLLVRLYAVSRKYAQLYADGSFAPLQSEIHKTERNIIVAGRVFDSAITEYNAAIQDFPTSMVARINGYRKKELFAPEETPRTAVFVDFSKKPVPTALSISEITSKKSEGL